MSITINGTTGVSGVDGSSTTPAFQGTDINTGLFYGTDIVGISTGGSERVRVDASGNVGIGTTSPTQKLHLYGSGVDFNQRIEAPSGTNKYLDIGTGNSGHYLYGSGAYDLYFGTAGTERMRIDSSGNFTAVIPSGSTSYPAFWCRAWVNFNGTGTVAIRGSGNVTSITDGGVGIYTINITTALPDTNGAVASGGAYNTPVQNDINGINAVITSTTAIAVNTFNTSTGGEHDATFINVAVFR